MSVHEPGTPGETATVVAATDVRRTYHLGEPVHALDGVSLSLEEGSFTAVMGPSGSGKSTLMNLFGCLDTPDEGTVEIDGRSVTALSGSDRARLRGTEIGFVFQTFNLMPRLTAAENVTMPMVFHDVVDEDRRARARTLLERVGLGDRLDHAPSELSGGQRQRVAIARALANEPTLLLADEPTGNLDTETGAEIMDLFRELHDDGRTILMVTHERAIAEHADRIVHLVDGTLDEIEEVRGSKAASGRDRSGSEGSE
ncbi:ABC transporter ATP-binding protein [Halobacteria archaeon AArc-m2/3/4]|uniref:ABC transporter ATP-binding protein n=1 Tax=Natronoglomus mannanivorans TaxID=2979990 RepID=A0ABT2QAY7_9EURY|nr:ABC transporter ATP-binding protein [Halobacteria archaeon AArc-m2/3/4]